MHFTAKGEGISMAPEDIEERIKNRIIHTLGLDITAAEIGSDELLFGGDLSLDSMASMEIIIGLEKEFEIEIGDENLQVEIFASVSNIAEYIRALF